MDYIINKDIKMLVEVTKAKTKERLPVLSKTSINAYSRALRKMGIKGGKR